MRKMILFTSLLFASLFSVPAIAQDNQSPQPADKTPTPAHYFHLTFAVQELGTDGKPINSRSYATTVSTDRRDASIRTTSQVPVLSGPIGSNSTQYTFVDVGINFDIREVSELGHQLSLHVKAEVNSYLPPEKPADIAAVRRHNQWESSLLVPIGKPTTIFTSDSLDGKGAMQVTATVTPIQ
jgi:hypothetical protein